MDYNINDLRLALNTNHLGREWIVPLISLAERIEEFSSKVDKDSIEGTIKDVYVELNRVLGFICTYLNCPVQQNQWCDPNPLVEMAKIFPEIIHLHWYRRHRQLMTETVVPPIFIIPLNNTMHL